MTTGDDPSNPLITILYPPDPSDHSPHPQCHTITKLPLALLLSTSTWAESKIENSKFNLLQVIPQGLDLCIVGELFDWLKLVSESLGEDAEYWGDTIFVRDACVEGAVVEVRVKELGLELGKESLLCLVETYLAFIALGIHGGSLDNSRMYLLEQILAIVSDPFQVLEVEEVIRLWECFYVFPEEVREVEEGVLRAALLKTAGTSEGNEALANSYVWGFQNAERQDLLKVFLGFMIEKEGVEIPSKEEEDQVEVEERFGIVPKLIVVGQSSKGLDLRKAEETAMELRMVKEEDKLFVGWRPKPRDIIMVDAPPLVEESFSIWEDATNGTSLETFVERPSNPGRPKTPRPTEWLKRRTSSHRM